MAVNLTGKVTNKSSYRAQRLEILVIRLDKISHDSRLKSRVNDNQFLKKIWVVGDGHLFWPEYISNLFWLYPQSIFFYWLMFTGIKIQLLMGRRGTVVYKQMRSLSRAFLVERNNKYDFILTLFRACAESPFGMQLRAGSRGVEIARTLEVPQVIKT